jgi:hypothetical protein
MVNSINIAEQNFQALLAERGILCWPEERLHEVLKPQNTKPDFFCKTQSGLTFLCEVESFERDLDLPSATGLAQFDPTDMFKRLCGAVERAGKQLKPYEHDGFPLVVALDNWRMIAIESGKYSLARVFGETRFVVSPPSSADSSYTELSRTRAELVGSKKLYLSCVSAVLWNFPSRRSANGLAVGGISRHVRVMHNPDAPTPFARQIFDHPEDEHYTIDEFGQVVDLRRVGSHGAGDDKERTRVAR